RLEERRGFSGSALAEKALAKVGLEIGVGAVAFHGGAVGFFGQIEFALLEIDVTEFGMMMGFVEMVNMGLEFFDAAPFVSTRQFEAAGGARLRAVNEEEVENGVDDREEKDEDSPKPFLAADLVNEHPDLDRKADHQPGLHQ